MRYRIVKVKGYNNRYVAQQRIMFVWFDITAIWADIDWCEYVIGERIKEDNAKRNNPKNIIVKEYY